MSIASSTNKTWPAWDGFIHVEERHTASTGKVYFISYTCPDSTNLATKMAANAALLADQLAEAEADEVIQ